MSKRISTIVLGGTGYVAGELVRLIAGHPRLALRAVISGSQPGAAVEELFPHLAGTHPGLHLSEREKLPALLERDARWALFAAGPHGESASAIDAVLGLVEEAGVEAHLVDLSADFRYDDAEEYERVYGCPHGAPRRISQFECAVPEHAPTSLPEHASHPGCFTTSVVLPVTALLDLDLIEPEVFVSAVTGSTGAGRTPRPTTHHPERLSNLFAYKVLEHRHQPEMEELVEAAAGERPRIAFVPHAGPFARGIHSTLHCRLREPMESAAVVEAVATYYREAAFVRVQDQPPRLKDVVGTNFCRIGLTARGSQLVVFSTIDNLVKGAAGGAVQWMNLLFGLEETAGLLQPGLGWL